MFIGTSFYFALTKSFCTRSLHPRLKPSLNNYHQLPTSDKVLSALGDHRLYHFPAAVRWWITHNKIKFLHVNVFKPMAGDNLNVCQFVMHNI